MELDAESYVHGGAGHPFIYKTLPRLLDEKATSSADKTAHVFRYVDRSNADRDKWQLSQQRQVITFKDMADKSLLLASQLLKIGLERGDRIAVVGECCPEWLYLEYAIMRVGMIMVRVPPTLVSRDSMETLMTKHRCKVLVVGPGKNNDMLDKIDGQALPGIITDTSTAIESFGLSLKHVFLLQCPADRAKYTSVQTLEELVSGTTPDTEAVYEIQNDVSPDDIGVVYATSGSEGFPKFPAYSHFAYVNLTQNLAPVLNLFDPNCVMYSDRPFTWIGSWAYLSVIFGIKMVHCEATNTKIVYDIMDEETVTSVLALAYILHDMLAFSQQGIPPPKYLKYCVIGGELIPSELLLYASKNFTKAKLGFGCSECFVIVVKDLSASDIEESQWMTATSYMEIKVSSDDGTILPPNEPGLISIRTPAMARQYLDDPERSSQAFLPSGWYSTGDIGTLNDRGELKILGRKKYVISKGGIKIYPRNVEEILIRHEKIKKIVVIGVPDPRLYNEVCACVVPEPGCTLQDGELLQFCRESFLESALNFTPRYYWVLEDFPLGRSGKVDIRCLTDMAIEHFNLQKTP